MKKVLSMLLVVVMLSSAFTMLASAETLTANPTTSKVLIDGVEKSFEAYNINDNNYFKLRDIAYCLSRTEKKFAIDWQADTNTAILETNKEYVAVGGELAVSSNFVSKNTQVSNTNILLNGTPVQAKAYIIDGNNYFKLRDLGQILDFSVEWEASQNALIINTIERYKEEIVNSGFVSKQTEFFTTQIDTISNWSRDSKIQQFNYMDKGIGYAYVDKEALNVVLPTHELTINLLYPKFADIIADNKISENTLLQPSNFYEYYSRCYLDDSSNGCGIVGENNYAGSVSDTSKFIRIAITGRENSPELYSIMKILGETECKNRINNLIKSL